MPVNSRRPSMVPVKAAWPDWLDEAKLTGEEVGVYAHDSDAASGNKGASLFFGPS